LTAGGLTATNRSMGKLIGILLAVLVLGASGCNRAKELRNKECEDFAEWSNRTGDPMGQSVSEAEKQAADTNEKRASMFRKYAEGARKASKGSIPFKDPYVHGLAERTLAVYVDVAVALDEQAAGWEKGDGEAVKRAVSKEVDAKARQKPISDEWMSHCRQ